ncbi:MAG: CBS domain-containing protein [Anaerolineales bacterium]|nr:CBS domain-containing protein [Anaerolineales bacterium]
MNLILTHEQADFDALASLFGAYLLDEQALPVLPRKMNRNLRAFLTLYGAEFPFVDPRDLPQGGVEKVTLVDTQSLVTIKGMDGNTRVHVIDHHPLRTGLADRWQVSISETGATTTVLVEALQERGGRLTGLQATLLLLGIYEDTGSLSYANTTVRDVRAVAYLLETGASLRIVAEFLNTPLSPEQRKVYDQLTSNVTIHEINGHRIAVACGHATEISEEISSLAHKLRDSIDPDALFLLLETVEGIRIVARSTSDEIDVSAILTHFGGGGHDRAAAALVRVAEDAPGDEALEVNCQKLLVLLPDNVRPSVTVSRLMSRGPQVLEPDTPVKEAAQLMQRYGYEGYPVVDRGEVVGLLTRRAVDRALAHKLNLTAASLMEAGAVTVHPDDSLQHLQTVMTDSGWGQVPVVDAAGDVIGIVTRTDILKTLAPTELRPTGRNLAGVLEKSLPKERLDLIKVVAKEAARHHVAVYVVGGFVRDLILERPSLDFDIVVEGDAIKLGRALGKRYGGRVTTHGRFGTSKWFLGESEFGNSGGVAPEFLDLISARTEFYEHPTALPIVKKGSIKLDLHRRDFTINTLALRLDGRHYGELQDYWGGLSDLESGRVRVLHSLSFVDDPTRILRAVRFEQRFSFKIESRTLQLIHEAHELLKRLSGERIRHEVDLILAEAKSIEMLDRLADLKLLPVIHPDLPWDNEIRARLLKNLDAVPLQEFGIIPELSGAPFRRTLAYLLWLLHLSMDELRSISKRMRFSASLKKCLLEAATLWKQLPALKGDSPSKWVAALENIPLLAVFAVYLSAGDSACEEALLKYLAEWQYVMPTFDGNTLRGLGLSPGPIYQKVLGDLRAAWLDGEIKTLEEEEKRLKELLECQA